MKKNVIYLNDWLAIHPYTTVCSSDTFFVELANKLYAACHLEELPEMFCKNLSLYVAAYLEDIISGLGLWQGFTTAHTRLYGRCLPFYPTGKDYIRRGKPGGYTLYHLEYMAEGSFLTRVCESVGYLNLKAGTGFSAFTGGSL